MENKSCKTWNEAIAERNHKTCEVCNGAGYYYGDKADFKNYLTKTYAGHTGILRDALIDYREWRTSGGEMTCYECNGSGYTS